MRLSVRFVQQKWEVIEHLRTNVMPTNRALAKNQFPMMIEKVIKEMKGEIKKHTFVRPRDGKEITSNVVMFPDGSFAAIPKVDVLFSEQRA